MSKSKIVVINSADRIGTLEASNQFTVKIQPAILNASRVSLAFVILPNSTYNITTSNNSISWDDGSVITSQIPVGSYNATTLASAVAAQMTATGSQTYTVTYNATTYHYTISAVTRAFSLFYEFYRSNSIFPTMGFRYNTNSLPASSFESNAAIQLWDSPFFTIRVDKIPSNVQTSQSASNFGTFVVNNTTAQDGTIRGWTQWTNFNEYTNISVNIDTLFIELRDHSGELANINDSDWVFGIQVWYD